MELYNYPALFQNSFICFEKEPLDITNFSPPVRMFKTVNGGGKTLNFYVTFFFTTCLRSVQFVNHLYTLENIYEICFLCCFFFYYYFICICKYKIYQQNKDVDQTLT